MTTDNMPPLPDQLEALSRDKRDHIRIYARAYAEQQTAELRVLLAECHQMILMLMKTGEQQTAEFTQQTAKLIAEKNILEKASSDNFALYYEAKRDRKELRAEVEELKAKIHCQDTYILELLTKLKDKQ